MKLNELNLDGYKHILKNNWELPENLIDWLEERDFELIGEGDLSKVYQSPTEQFVVKVNKGNVEKEYETFVNFCRRNSSDPHLPKFGQMKMIENNNMKFYVLFIEKLEIAPDSKGVYMLCKFLQKAWMMIKGDANTYNSIDNAEELLEYLKNYDEKYDNGIMFKSDIAIQYLSLIKTLFKMSECIKSIFLDLHSENLGLRNDGTIVILDPVRALEN